MDIVTLNKQEMQCYIIKTLRNTGKHIKDTKLINQLHFILLLIFTL